MVVALKEKQQIKQVFPKQKKFTVKELEKLYEIGILKPYEKVELINGEIYKMSPAGLRHTRVVDILGDIFNDILRTSKELRAKYIVSIQNTLKISQNTLLYPDIMILKRDYLKENRYQQPKDVEILVEVSDKTLRFDKNIKISLYAKAKIKTLWIVNLVDNQLEIYENPEKGKYKDIHIKTKNDEIKILGQSISLKEIFK